MIALTPQMRILVAVAPVDFRNGIDGLGGVCRRELREDPLSGCVFVFRNRRGTAVKVLVYDGQGFWLCQNYLSSGAFAGVPLPPLPYDPARLPLHEKLLRRNPLGRQQPEPPVHGPNVLKLGWHWPDGGHSRSTGFSGTAVIRSRTPPSSP